MKVAFLTISGYIQGVGYRQFVKKEARKLGLTGWVQNMIDKTVEVKVFGKQENIERLIALCKKGPFLAEVKEVQVEWAEEDNPPSDFTIAS